MFFASCVSRIEGSTLNPMYLCAHMDQHINLHDVSIRVGVPWSQWSLQYKGSRASVRSHELRAKDTITDSNHLDFAGGM
jgi:hypothetical protein